MSYKDPAKKIAAAAKWYQKNKDRIKLKGKKYRAENKDQIKEREQRYRKTKRGRENRRRAGKKYARERYKKNPECQRKISRDWAKAHPESVREKSRRRRATIRGQLDNRLRRSVAKGLRQNGRGRTLYQLLGYSIEELKQHIEKQFQKNMTWGLFLDGKIHIDHKIPVSAFNYTQPEHMDFKRCWSLNNLQPMWAKENLSKHAKLNKPFQPGLAF